MSSKGNLPESYEEWVQILDGKGLMPIEFLLPQIRTPVSRNLPRLMGSQEPSNDKTIERLKKKCQELGPWGYGIQLTPGVVTESQPAALGRMIYRSHLISDTTIELLGDDLRASSVLDMASNHGYFALELAHAGAKKAVGVDFRRENIQKSNFLSEHFKIENVEFRQQNVYDLDISEKFDVVYNLGLFYHITDPYLLMKHTYDMCTRLAVIDSVMHREPVSAYIQTIDKDITVHAEGEFTMELHPTYRAMIDLMKAVGFKDIHEVVAVAPASGEIAAHKLYEQGQRRCLIGFK